MNGILDLLLTPITYVELALLLFLSVAAIAVFRVPSLSPCPSALCCVSPFSRQELFSKNYRFTIESTNSIT